MSVRILAKPSGITLFARTGTILVDDPDNPGYILVLLDEPARCFSALFDEKPRRFSMPSESSKEQRYEYPDW